MDQAHLYIDGMFLFCKEFSQMISEVEKLKMIAKFMWE